MCILRWWLNLAHKMKAGIFPMTLRDWSTTVWDIFLVYNHIITVLFVCFTSLTIVKFYIGKKKEIMETFAARQILDVPTHQLTNTKATDMDYSFTGHQERKSCKLKSTSLTLQIPLCADTKLDNTVSVQTPHFHMSLYCQDDIHKWHVHQHLHTELMIVKSSNYSILGFN